MIFYILYSNVYNINILLNMKLSIEYKANSQDNNSA